MQESLIALDHVRLNFSPESLHTLNIALAIIMFGVALEIKVDRSLKKQRRITIFLLTYTTPATPMPCI